MGGTGIKRIDKRAANAPLDLIVVRIDVVYMKRVANYREILNSALCERSVAVCRASTGWAPSIRPCRWRFSGKGFPGAKLMSPAKAGLVLQVAGPQQQGLSPLRVIRCLPSATGT
jgi:hypothetical protein